MMKQEKKSEEKVNAIVTRDSLIPSPVRLLILVAFLLATGYLAVTGALTQDNMSQLLHLARDSGARGILFFTVVFAVATALFFPTPVLIAMSGILYGQWQGAALSLAGLTGGSVLAFVLSRFFLKNALERLFGNRIDWLNRLVERRGFIAFALLRVFQMPFSPINYCAGLTKVRFPDFVLGNLIGVVPCVLILTYSASNLVAIHSLSDIFTHPKIILAGFLFTFLVISPLLLRKLKAYRGLTDRS